MLRNSPLPLYYQVQEALRERIASGEWAPGDQIPTIRALCEQYGVSRITIGQALTVLAQEGLLTSHQGKGVFVAQPKIEQGPVRLISFTDDISRRGHTASSQVLALECIPAPAEIAVRLELEPGAPVVALERLRLADSQPMGIQRAYLPERYFPNLATIAEPIDSLYRLLQERYSVIPTQATDTYEPVRLDRATAALLGVRPGAPAFSVERITRDQRNRLIEYVQSILRGDRYKVVLTLERL
jgi:GntR family transcriptional regulator